jgi:hypothetical protein
MSNPLLSHLSPPYAIPPKSAKNKTVSATFPFILQPPPSFITKPAKYPPFARPYFYIKKAF